MKPRFLCALLAGVVLATSGCSSVESDSRHSTFIPARRLDLTPSFRPSAEGLLAAGIIFFIVDPLAPNWKVEVESLGQHRYRLDLTMKRFITGGEGEAAQVVRRTAEKLRKEGGYAEYSLLEMSEGIESRVPIAQRVASATVELR